VSALAAAGWADEAELASAWRAGVGRRLRLADGRALQIIFPGVAGGGPGPDVQGAILDAGGDFLRGDVEFHLRASGWRAHGHHLDPAYASVVLHVVGENDGGALATLHSARVIPILELRRVAAPGPRFVPPCVLSSARGGSGVDEALARLGLRRLRLKAARVRPLVDSSGPGQALYTLLLETLGGPANREPFAALARRLPLALLAERAESAGVSRPLALTAELKGAAAALSLRRAGGRPMASPTHRLEAAGRLLARLWPAGGERWPGILGAGAALPRVLAVEGLGRGLALELAVNAVLPVALCAGAWGEAAVEAAYATLPAPGTYGKLKSLEGWLGHGPGGRPFGTARALQGGLLLHTDYCTKGRCGRCPLSG
jgi:Protein of unknown function (DUF2851)